MIDGDGVPTIDAPRVRLRQLVEADVEGLFEVFSDREMMRYWSSPAMKARAEAEDLLMRVYRQFAEKSGFQWGVERKEDGRLLGTCTIFHIHAKNRCGEIGYALKSEHWRKGYMGEALRSLLDYVFGPMNLRRLEADVDPRNAASLAILGKLGFQHEGLLRERWDVEGDIQDSVFLGLLNREWKARRA